MADTLPPDENRNAGENRSSRSGKVADFRYKRSFQQDRPGARGKRSPNGKRGRKGAGERREPETRLNERAPQPNSPKDADQRSASAPRASRAP
ncbi:MAG: hypothetical protein AAFY81_05335, partial [Pseudomonadota bacterium]